jgi:hypothetical protein
MSLRLAACAALAALPALPAAADDVLTTADGIVRNFLCVGAGCVDPESFGTDTVKLKAAALRLLFEDTSTGTGLPGNDWRLVANDLASGGRDYFALVDATSNRQVVRVEAGARTNAIFVDDKDRVGLGTSLPQDSLHVLAGRAPTLRLEQDTSQGEPPITWRLSAGTSSFAIIGGQDPNSLFKIPFAINTAAPSNSLRIATNGNIGLGISSPQASLDIFSNSGDAQVRVSETNFNSSPRTLLNLVNNGRPEIVLANTDTGGEWSFGAGTNFILKQGAVGSTSSAKTKLFEIDDAGNASLTGTLTTGGTTCGTGCDAVFAPDYPLPSIAEHAAQMQALGYLPNVGPTPENTPIDLTDKLGRMLNELEHAHLYIAQLEGESHNHRAEIAALRHNHDQQIARLRAEVAALRKTLAPDD